MSNTTETVSNIHFTFEHHTPLLIIAVITVVVLVLLCNLLVATIHINESVFVADEESKLNIKRIWANDMTAFTGAVAAMATLVIALVDELPMDAQLVLAFVAACLTMTSTYYFIVANRNDASATYLDINKATAKEKK